MNPDLATRIQKAYPNGIIDEPDESAFKSVERDGRLKSALESASVGCHLQYLLEPFDRPDYSIAITQQEHPSFSEWAHQMSEIEELSWIREQQQPYTVFWLKVSRVADYYRYYYNYWNARVDEDRLDIDFKSSPSALWLGYEQIIKATLEEHGFVYCTDEVALEKTSFVMERDYDAISDDDPQWEKEGFEPPLVPSAVVSCLFSQ